MTSNIDPDLEKVFQATWTNVELHYASWILIHGNEFFTPLYRLLYILRRKGYASKLRIGLSVTAVILSRSQKQGLRPDQPFIGISVNTDGNYDVYYWDATAERSFPANAVTLDLAIPNNLRRCIDELTTYPID